MALTVEQIKNMVKSEIEILEDIYKDNLTDYIDDDGNIKVKAIDEEKSRKLRYAIMELESVVRYIEDKEA